MSSTFKPAGQSDDFSNDPATLVKTELTDNWNDTTGVVAESDIKFGQDWYDGQGDYQIHVTDVRYDIAPASNDWKRFHYHAFVDIHIFVRRVSEDQPSQFYNLIREVNRIIGQNVQGVTGVSFMRWAPAGGLTQVPEPDHQKSVWHARGTVELYWHQVSTA